MILSIYYFQQLFFSSLTAFRKVCYKCICLDANPISVLFAPIQIFLNQGTQNMALLLLLLQPFISHYWNKRPGRNLLFSGGATTMLKSDTGLKHIPFWWPEPLLFPWICHTVQTYHWNKTYWKTTVSGGNSKVMTSHYSSLGHKPPYYQKAKRWYAKLYPLEFYSLIFDVIWAQVW